MVKRVKMRRVGNQRRISDQREPVPLRLGNVDLKARIQKLVGVCDKFAVIRIGWVKHDAAAT